MNDRRVIVTGAFGFLGRNLLRMAREADSNETWIALSPEPCPGDLELPRRATIEHVDLADAAALRRICSDVQPDAVVHLAAVTNPAETPENRAKVFRVNVAGTADLLYAIERNCPTKPHFIVASSGLVYGNQTGPFVETMDLRPKDVYGLSKLLVEEAVKAYGRVGAIRPCILRPAILYGPGQGGSMLIPTMIAALREGKRFPMTEGAQLRDFVYVDDMVRAIMVALGSGLEGTFNVGTGKGVAIRMVAELIGKLFDRPHLLGFGEVPYRESEVWSYTLDPSRLHAEGWVPKVSFEAGLRCTIEGRS